MQMAWLWWVKQIIKVQIVEPCLDQNLSREIRHFRKNCPKQKDKREKEKTFDVANIASEEKKIYDVEIILAVFVGSLSDG
jgi:hypothetical protein